MNALHPLRMRSTTDLSPAIGHAMASFMSAQTNWAESTTQDAIESVARIPWLVQVRSGVRVPVHVLYRKSAQRLAQTEVTRFVQTHARQVAAMLDVPAAALHLSGWEVLQRASMAPPAADPLIKRTWMEGEVPWRLRFEQAVRTEIRTRGTTPLQDWLESTLLAVVATWGRTTRARLERGAVIQ